MFDPYEIFSEENETWRNRQYRDEIDMELSFPRQPEELVEETGVPIKEEEGSTYEMRTYGVGGLHPVDFVQWIGRVIEIQEERFIAKVDAVNISMVSKIVTFNTERSCIFNREYMEEGATFVWTIGLFPKSLSDRTLVKKSEIRFRLIQDLDADYFDTYAMEKSRELIEGISWLE